MAEAKTEALFRLRRPCANCPFRTDVPGYLRRERARQIAEDLANGAIFHCHKTTEDDGEGDLVGTADSSFCAGALILMEKAQAPNQAMRTAERLDLYDPERMDTEVPVHDSFVSFVSHHGDEETEEQECCHIANMGCEAPAGYLIGGAVVPAEEGEVHECPDCGQSVCAACSNDTGVCVYCAEAE